ncbi:Response regulator receiver domain-containing protein [Arboricoccus pini]|uniref:Response regulator receiver domain-containing protein n=1 Tax=Arboricoccus pini TaxID=1963835 RepID=A0A212RQ66_9PROT|nr:response regulator [Arboricoccus pini]SNB74598.1 Response regulator receiver domain-containing protein [Arboricoccus pini]
MTQKPTLLFVDDEERVVKLLKIMFRADYQVFTANSGREALAILEAHHIDVIASDQRMPEMLGIELLAQAAKRWPHSVRILLTGYSDLVAIIGAVNEGEVFRFLNKPWNQDELRAVIAEAVQISQRDREAALAAAASPQGAPAEDVARSSSQLPLATAAKLLAIDGIASDRQEVVEMFTQDYHVITASTIETALEMIEMHDVGVIVTNSIVDGVDITDMLAAIREQYPAITVVVVTTNPDSDTIIKLINRGQIYRFAMKPLSPNIFRLAVGAAMREYHRRLADIRLSPPTPRHDPSAVTSGVFESFVRSIARFTKVRDRSSL